MHQKERINLPVFKQDIEAPNFSKSAPDLDKARTGTPSSTNSSYNELGKSYDEGLSTISRPNYLESNVLSGSGYTDRMLKLDSNDKSTFNKNNKKYSLDSKIEKTDRQLTNRQLKLSHSFDEEGSMGYKHVYNNNESLTYDRTFHKKMQKSLEMLTTYVSSSQDSEDLAKVFWKSSDHLSSSMRLDDSSQFQRAEFFTNYNHTSDTSSLISSNSILKSNHLRSNSRMSSQENSDVDAIINRIRKTSVTFYKNDEDYSNSGSLQLNSLTEKPKGKVLSFYHKLNSRSHSSQLDKQKSKILKTPQFVHKLKDKFNYNKNKIKYQDTIYNKEKDSSSNINEKLLESDAMNAIASDSTNSQYDTVYYTKNFVIASNNSKN